MNARLFILIALATLTGMGCKTISASPPGVLLINEKALGRQIAVEQFASAATETGTRKVWAGVRNKTKARVMVEARALFRGDQGEPVEPEAGWRQIFVEPGATTVFDFYSMTRNAKQVTVEIRAGNL